MNYTQSSKRLSLLSATLGKLLSAVPARQFVAVLGCVLAASLLTACSSVKTQVNKGAVKARTFSFMNTGARQLPAYAQTEKQLHAMVQQALVKNLAGKGLTYVPSGGEVTVAYLIVAGNNATTTSLNDYFGYTPDSEALVQEIHAAQTGDEKRGYFEAGTLVIDLVDPATSKLLQRRSIRGEVFRNASAETRTARIQAAVDQALKDLPVAH